MMKKPLLFLVCLLVTFCATRAQSLINYSATLFYNSINNTVQVTLFVQNTNNGNGVWVDLAAIQFSLRYNSTNFSLTSYGMIPAGSGLDAAGDSNLDQPDATNTTTVTIGGKTYTSLNITRSTNICNNVLRLAPNSATYPVFVANFNVLVASPTLYYDFTTPANNDYPAEFQVAASPTSAKKDILMFASSSYDQNGNNNSCTDGNIKLKPLTDDPGTPTQFYNANGPLPVKWLSFDVIKQNNKAQLVWQTSLELNNRGFEVQRKINNRFEKIGFVSSKALNGNSAADLNYEFTDADLPANATSYYRIKQDGYDKPESYSEIKLIRTNVKSLQVLIYPNPAHDVINVIIPGSNGIIDIKLVDFSGRLIKTITNNKVQNLHIKGLRTGIYSIQITNRETGETTSQKLTVL